MAKDVGLAACIRPDGFFAGKIRKLRDAAATLGATFTLLSIDRLLARIDRSEVEIEDLLVRISLIHGRLNDELASTCLLYVPAEAAKYLDDKVPLFGDEVAKAFPSAAYDITEAGKCLGLRRATAWVTHLMRALEVTLGILGAKLGVITAHTNWHNFINQIENKISAMNNSSHGPGWKDEQAFYAAGAVHFRMLKDGWRNHAIHVREKYTEEQAEDIYRSTQSFIRHLSQRLSETPEQS